MSLSRGKQVLKRHKAMESDSGRRNFENLWQESLRLTQPNKEYVHTFREISSISGEQKTNRLLDTSASIFNVELASALSAKMTNPNSTWFEFTTGFRNLERNVEVRDYLQLTGSKLHEFLRNSNFYTEVDEFYNDLPSICTAVMFIEEDKEDLFRFKSIPVYQLHFEENWKGEVNMVSREIIFTLRQAVDKFGEEAFLKSPKLKKLITARNVEWEKDFIVVHQVAPVDQMGKKLKGRGFKFGSLHVDKEHGVVLKEGGFRTFPYVVSRWRKTSGEKFGRGPGIDTIPDNRMLQAYMKVNIRGSQKAIDPPLLVNDDSVLGRVNLNPGGLTSTRTKPGEAIAPLQTGSNPLLGEEMMENIRQRIGRHFFADKLRIREADRQTTVEINAQLNQNLEFLAPQVARMNSEFLKILITRCLDIMKRRNELPEPIPEPLREIDLQVFYSSQIARAQKLGQAQTLNILTASLAPLGEIDPSIYDNIDFDKATKLLAQLHGAPMEIFRKEKDVQKLREDRAKEEQEFKQQQEQLANSETVRNLAPGVKAARGG